MSYEERIDIIMLMIDEGHAKQILISHDIQSCHQLPKCGGMGFILRTFMIMPYFWSENDSFITMLLIR